MSSHDDYLDMASAWEAYDKAYVAWGRLVDGTEKCHFKDVCKDEKKIRRAERRLYRALRHLHNAAESELHNSRWSVARRQILLGGK